MSSSTPDSKDNDKPASPKNLPQDSSGAKPLVYLSKMTDQQIAQQFADNLRKNVLAELSDQEIGQRFVDNLNRNVLAEHAEDLARLPPEVRAQKTPEEWLKTPTHEIMNLVRQNSQTSE